jgi:hypothetical protein
VALRFQCSTSRLSSHFYFLAKWRSYNIARYSGKAVGRVLAEVYERCGIECHAASPCARFVKQSFKPALHACMMPIYRSWSDTAVACVCVCVCVWLERCDIDRYWDTCLFCVQLAWLAWLTWQVIVISTPSMQSAEGSHATVHYSRLQCPFHCAGNAVRLAGRSDSLTALSCVWPTSRYCMRAIGGRVRSAVEASYLLQ